MAPEAFGHILDSDTTFLCRTIIKMFLNTETSYLGLKQPSIRGV